MYSFLNKNITRLILEYMRELYDTRASGCMTSTFACYCLAAGSRESASSRATLHYQAAAGVTLLVHDWLFNSTAIYFISRYFSSVLCCTVFVSD